MREGTAVVSHGASTSVGRTSWASAAAVRAGINQFGDHPFMIDRVGEPMRVARCAWLHLSVGGVTRLQALLEPAIDEAMSPLRTVPLDGLRFGWALALAENRPGKPPDLRSSLVSWIDDACACHVVASAVFEEGHSGGLQAMRAACGKLDRNELDICLVLGADSYLEPAGLDWLEACEQLHGAGLLNNAWGFIPGEGAGALLLCRSSVASMLGLVPRAAVLSVGMGLEPHPIKTSGVCVGEGITSAIRSALTALPSASVVDDIYCDLNGESYRADEYGFAMLRVKERFRQASSFVAAADCWGDVGASGGILNCILAAIAMTKKYAAGPVALISASAERGGRAAALIRALDS